MAATELKIQMFPTENLAEWKSIWDWLLAGPLVNEEATNDSFDGQDVGGHTEHAFDKGADSC